MSHTPEPWSYELDHCSDLRIYSETNSNIVYGCGCCESPTCDDEDAAALWHASMRARGFQRICWNAPVEMWRK